MSLFKNSKRLFAALLCLCMVVAVLPAAAPAAQAAVGTTVSFDFRVTDADVDADGNPVTALAWAALKTKWTIQASDQISSAGANSNYFNFFSKEASVNEWVALQIEIPEAGVYDASLLAQQQRSACTSEIYFMPADVTVADSFTSQYYIGKLAGFASAANEEYYPALKKIVVPEGGSYLLAFKITEACPYASGYNNRNNNFICKLDMTKIADAPAQGTTLYSFTSNPVYGWAQMANLFPGSAKSDNLSFSAIGVDCMTTFTKEIPGEWLAIPVNVPSTGAYQPKVTFKKIRSGGIADLYMIPATVASTADAIAAEIADEDYYVGTVDFYTAGSEFVAAEQNLAAINVEAAGDYMFVIKNTGVSEIAAGYANASDDQGATYYKRYYTYISGLELTKLESMPVVTPTESDIFGEIYAYIREEATGADTTYTIELLGGVETLEGYSEVGFEVMHNSKKHTAGGNEVYAALKVGGSDISVTEFGSKVSHVFHESFELADATNMLSDDVITFKAYAVDADGNVEYSDSYRIALAK